MMNTDTKSPETIGGENSQEAFERDNINLSEEYEVKAWCEMFGVTTVDLKRAIEQVGPSALKVKYYLQKAIHSNALDLKNNLTV